jgi:2-isopropylmalate synthase
MGQDGPAPAFGVELGPPFYSAGRWVSPWNFDPEVQQGWIIPDKVDIHDTTLRDGEQTARVVFTPEEKIAISVELDALGVASIEPGLLVSKEDREVSATLAKMGLRAQIKPLVRVKKEDVESAIESGVPAIVLEFGINPYLIKYCYDTTPDALLQDILEYSKAAKSAGMEVEFMGWDVFRIPSFDYIETFFRKVVDGGSVDRITVADTFGMAHPDASRVLFRRLRASLPEVPLGLHIHNDYGMATAGALTALTSGASSVHTTINGLGERAGNAATEEIAAGLQLLLGIDAGIKLERLSRVAHVVAEASKRPLAPNKPIVGSRLFEVESGIVVHILRQMASHGFGEVGFAPYAAAEVGQTPYTVIAGRGSGHHAVAALLEGMGITATEDEIAEIGERVRQLSLVLKNGVPDRFLQEMVDGVVDRTTSGDDRN